MIKKLYYSGPSKTLDQDPPLITPSLKVSQKYLTQVNLPNKHATLISN